MTRTNISIVNNHQERVEYFVKPEDAPNRMPQIRADLAAYQAEEPRSGWKLQARGEQNQTWHDWKA